MRLDLFCGDALEVVRGLPDQSVDMILTDPPYFLLTKGPAADWDQQWSSRDEFIAWLGAHFAEWRRVLRPGGSVFVFMGARMVSAVEMELERHFAVLSNIVWNKPRGSSMLNAGRKTDYRAWQHVSERALFAEHLDEEAGKQRREHAIRADLYAPIREWLAAERDRAGLSNKAVDAALGTKGMAGHYFGASQWAFPHQAAYKKIQAAAPGHFIRPWSDLRAEYDRIRADAEHAGHWRFFRQTADDEWADVWSSFPATPNRPGRHPCEKPGQLLDHIIRATTTSGQVILDPFAGSHAIGKAALRLGRGYIGVELDTDWHRKGAERLAAIQLDLPMAAE